MKISMILAMDENNGIGIKNQLPWHLSEDLKRFRKLTMNHHIIMGRKTHESIGRPLPGRVNLILTRSTTYQAEGCIGFNQPDDAIQYAAARDESEIFIIGGAKIFDVYMAQTDRIYLTVVHAVGNADTFFPSYDEAEWIEKSSQDFPADDDNQYPTTFKILDRKR